MRRTADLLVALVLAACTGAPGSVKPSAPEATPTTAATPSPTQTEVPTPTATPVPSPTELVLDQHGFVRLEWGPGSDSDTGYDIHPTTLVIGTLDGQVTARIEAGLNEEWDWIMSDGRSVRRWASPAAGRVLWADGTQLHLVDATSGEDRIVYEAPLPIDHGALSPDGSTAFLAQREEGSANWSIWRIDLAGAAEPEQLRAAQPESVAATGIVLARTSSVFVRVAVAPDGGTLAVAESGSIIRTWTMDLSTGAKRTYLDVGPWPLRGVIGDWVLDQRAYNLESGEVTDGECVPALQTDGTAVLVCSKYVLPTTEDEPRLLGVDVIDPRTGANRQAPLDEGRGMTVPHLADLNDAYPRVELPAGWVLVEEVRYKADQDCSVWTLYAWNIDTGDLVPLPGVFPAWC